MHISRQTIAALIAHARKDAPLEACGYLAEKNGIVCRHFALTNTDRAADHYSMDPAEQFAAVKEMRQTGMRLRAVYHSHPESPARPSAEDIRLAYDPTISYVIVSLLEQETVRAFRISGKKVQEEAVTVTD